MVRNLIALAVENDPEKMPMVNEFICQLAPYTMQTRQQSSKKNTTYGALRGLVSGDNNTYFLKEFDDFTICNWVRLLYMAKKDPNTQLTQETQSYIQNKLLVLEGREFDGEIRHTRNFLFRGIAGFAGFATTDKGIRNSENHLLMVNGSAYLKNQLHAPELNAGSDLEVKLCAFLDDLSQHGLTEFNSIPYAGYTIDALLNLHDFANEPVKDKATRVLDKIFYDYAAHSTKDGQSFRPFSRLAKNGSKTDFRRDNHMRAFMSSWIGLDPNYYLKAKQDVYCNYAFTGLTTSYCLPQVVYDLAISTMDSYLAVTGQPHGNAEVSYKNTFQAPNTITLPPKQYLLSGGGLSNDSCELRGTLVTTGLSFFGIGKQSAIDKAVNDKRRLTSDIVSRNPVLILNGQDGTKDLSECFYLGTNRALDKNIGPGVDSKAKNNSGIYFDTLVGPYPVQIPEAFQGQGIKAELTEGVAQSWTLYQIEPGLCVATFDDVVPMKKSGQDRRQVGIIMVLPGMNASQALINQVVAENQDPNRVGQKIKFPDVGSSVMRGRQIRFNPYAALDRYVMTGVDEKNRSVSERTFYARALTNGGHAPGWSAQTVIQTTPEERPRYLLNDTEQPFTFLDVTTPSLTDDNFLDMKI